MTNKVWVNKKLMNADSAKISVFDRGFLYGDAAFETMRSYAGVVFRMRDHMDRLFNALKTLGINMPHSKYLTEGYIKKTLHVNDLKSAYVRIAVTRGSGSVGLVKNDKLTPNVVIFTKDFTGYPEWMYRNGISVKIAGIVRQDEMSALSGIKSASFLNYILARIEAQRNGFDDSILLNTKGCVVEAATSNIFLVRNGSLLTPSLKSGALPGITRNIVISIAGKLRLRLEERSIRRSELFAANEVFFTNSLAEILPVSKINGKRVRDGRPGEITKLLHISYQKRVIEEIVF